MLFSLLHVSSLLGVTTSQHAPFVCRSRSELRLAHLSARCAGFEDAKALARSEGQAALEALEGMPEGDERRSLELMVQYVLKRIY